MKFRLPLLKLYIITLVVFLAIDFVWLGAIANSLYFTALSHLTSPEPNLLAAFLFYLLYVLGVIVFAVLPYTKEKTWKKSAMYGAFFGLCAYATYDLTNFATLRDWPVHIVIIDLLWGSVLTGVVSGVAYKLARHFRV